MSSLEQSVVKRTIIYSFDNELITFNDDLLI